MCMVSVVGDLYKDKWKPQPWYPDPLVQIPQVSRFEFDQLRKEVSDLKELLKIAKKYDVEHNQPDCEIEDKMALLRQVAKAVGINLDDALKPNST